MAYRPERGWGFGKASADNAGQAPVTEELAQLRQRVSLLEGLTSPEAKVAVIKPVVLRNESAAGAPTGVGGG